MKRGLSRFLSYLLYFAMAAVLVQGAAPPAIAETIEDLKKEMQILKQKIEENKALEERVKTLEKKLEEVEKTTATVKKEEAVTKEKKGSPAFAYWRNGFYLATPDDNFNMRIGGNIHFDTKFYGGNSENPSPQFDVRRARIDFQGAFYKNLTFRLQAEFADSPYIRNAWVDYKFTDWLHLRAGQMKPPFSTSWWTMDNNVNFLERGSSTPVYPYFDRGFWVWGDVLNNTLTWNLSAWTGAGMELDYPKGDIDDHKDIIARLFYTPFKNDKGNLLQGLNLSLEGSYGRQSIPTSRFETSGMKTAIRDDNMYKWQTEQTFSKGEIGQRDRWGAEVQYIYGPLSFSSEFLQVMYKNIDVFDKTTNKEVISKDGQITSWSTWVGYFLTGESMTVSNFGWRQPNPRVNFNPFLLKGIGAWEVLARYTHTDVSDDLFDTTTFGGNKYRILSGAPWTDEYTAGVNWTWNPMVRWQLNYTHITAGGSGLYSGDKNNLAGQGQSENEDMVGMRMIFKF